VALNAPKPDESPSGAGNSAEAMAVKQHEPES